MKKLWPLLISIIVLSGACTSLSTNEKREIASNQKISIACQDTNHKEAGTIFFNKKIKDEYFDVKRSISTDNQPISHCFDLMIEDGSDFSVRLLKNKKGIRTISLYADGDGIYICDITLRENNNSGIFILKRKTDLRIGGSEPPKEFKNENIVCKIS